MNKCTVVVELGNVGRNGTLALHTDVLTASLPTHHALVGVPGLPRPALQPGVVLVRLGRRVGDRRRRQAEQTQRYGQQQSAHRRWLPTEKHNHKNYKNAKKLQLQLFLCFSKNRFLKLNNIIVTSTCIYLPKI